MGRRGKAADLLTRMPHLQGRPPPAIGAPSTGVLGAGSMKDISTSTSSSLASNELDLTSVLKAAQSLSAEIVLSRLLPRLVSIVVEYTGAERGSLLFFEGETLVVAAESSVEGKGASAANGVNGAAHVSIGPRPMRSIADHPSSVLKYVQRTAEQVLIEDANVANKFGSDPYFRGKQHKSVLCKPIKHQGRLIAMIYLENDLVAGAFSPGRLVSLEVLAAQTAISIENSRLYSASQAAIVARDEFLSIASHELRTPLTPLAIHVHRISSAIRKGTLRGMADASLLKIANACDDQIARLSRLVGTLLDVSRIGSGHLSVERGAHDLSELTASIVEAHAAEALAGGCAIRITIEPGVIAEIDRERIEQVVANLVLNAVKFGRGEPVEISVHRVADRAVFQVVDHGPGIAAADRQRIFQRFERVASATNVDGIGLGLFIVRAIVDAHEGSIEVDETPGGGSTFRVTLRAA